MAKAQSPGEAPARRRPGKTENITSTVSQGGGPQSGLLSAGYCVNSFRAQGWWEGEPAWPESRRGPWTLAPPSWGAESKGACRFELPTCATCFIGTDLHSSPGQWGGVTGPHGQRRGADPEAPWFPRSERGLTAIPHPLGLWPHMRAHQLHFCAWRLSLRLPGLRAEQPPGSGIVVAVISKQSPREGGLSPWGGLWGGGPSHEGSGRPRLRGRGLAG